MTTNLARTRDWKTYERLGCIFTPDNKDVCIFPRKSWLAPSPVQTEHDPAVAASR